MAMSFTRVESVRILISFNGMTSTNPRGNLGAVVQLGTLSPIFCLNTLIDDEGHMFAVDVIRYTIMHFPDLLCKSKHNILYNRLSDLPCGARIAASYLLCRVAQRNHPAHLVSRFGICIGCPYHITTVSPSPFFIVGAF